jgi:quercetin dioxygenase-like cupin family protein
MILRIGRIITMSAEPNSKSNLSQAEAHDLVQLADYADGAIVSRTLAENASGTITLFAFDAGQNLSEHTTPFDAFVQILDGKAELIIGGKTVEASNGQIVLMPANVPHAVKAPVRFKMLLTILRSSKKE